MFSKLLRVLVANQCSKKILRIRQTIRTSSKLLDLRKCLTSTGLYTTCISSSCPVCSGIQSVYVPTSNAPPWHHADGQKGSNRMMWPYLGPYLAQTVPSGSLRGSLGERSTEVHTSLHVAHLIQNGRKTFSKSLRTLTDMSGLYFCTIWCSTALIVDGIYHGPGPFPNHSGQLYSDLPTSVRDQ